VHTEDDDEMGGPCRAFSEAFGINARGDVIGRSTTAGEVEIHAFLWTEKDGMQDLGTLGGVYSQPFAINDSGEITGFSTVAGDAEFHAVVWLPGGGKGQAAAPQIRDLGTAGGSVSEAIALNSQGDVVGVSNTAGDLETHAFLWTQRDGMKDLGTLGGTFSLAMGINNRGEVVGGAALPDGIIHAVYR
jgi:probable HAF family extracellular repeat protein